MLYKLKPVFRTPQWQIRKATEKRDYPLPMSNVLVIDYESGKQKQIIIEVPSQIYKFLHDRFKNYIMPDLVSFYIDEVSDIDGQRFAKRDKFKRWYLGIEYRIDGKTEYLDLWYYTNSNVPAWV